VTPRENMTKSRNATGRKNRADDILAPSIKAIINKQAVLSSESTNVEITTDITNNCFGRYIFLNKDSFASNAPPPWLRELEKTDQGIIAANKNIAYSLT
jgi:hypothetical protein